MKKIILILLLLLGLSVALLFWIKPPSMQNLVITGGTILTMSNPPEVEAIWISNGRIKALGDINSVRTQAAGANEVDLNGATLMPGLIEPHTHPLATAMLGQAVDVSGFSHQSRDSIMEALRRAAGGIAWRKWIVAFGWDPAMLDDLEPPSLDELDAISPERPMVILTQMMHDAYLNTAALKAAGITADTPDPVGAEFVRNSQGELTGTIREVRAIEQVFNAMPAIPTGVPELLLNRQYAEFARAGFTTLGVLGPVARADDPLGIMSRLAEHPAVPVRTVVYGLPAQLDEERWPAGTSTGDRRFIVRGVKFWLDGSPWAGGAAWDEPYRNSAFVRERLHLPKDHRGRLNYSDAEISKLFEHFHRRGYQIAMHVQGERAVRQALNATEQVLTSTPTEDHRTRLEHNALITERQLARMHTLGMTPGFFIDHILFYGHRISSLVGRDRAERYMPVASAFRMGHRATLHADNPATPISPFRVMQTAVMRQTAYGDREVLGTRQRISIEQALQALTINAAWQLGIDKETGSLEVGKQADLVVLSANPLVTAVESLSDIEVENTWLQGRPVKLHWFSGLNLSLAWDMVSKALSDSP